jgi:hypothetical protein
MEAKVLKAKIDDDFNGALKHRHTTPMEKWVLVHNDHDDLPTEAHEHVIALRNQYQDDVGVETWGPESLLSIIMEIPRDRLRLLFPEGLSGHDLRRITYAQIDELIESLGTLEASTDFSSPDEPSIRKIEHNGFSEPVSQMLRSGLISQQKFADYFRETSRVTVGSKLAQHFKNVYLKNRASATDADELFFAILDSVGGLSCAKARRAAIIGLVSYLFHTCDIFENVPSEAVA